MRILITTNGENIFSEEERQDLLEKKFRSTTTNKRYLKKLTIEKFTSKYDTKKPQNTKPKSKNYFIPAGIAYKPDDFFSKTTSTFYPKTIRINTEIKNTENFNKFRKIRINMKKVVFPKVLQTKYELDKIQHKEESDEINEEIKSNKENKIKTELKYSLGEIIDNKNVNKLKKEVMKRERTKEKLSVITEQNFRTNYMFKPKIQELKEILNYKKIRGDKLELIKYINTHNHITDLFLKNLVTSGIDDINKYEKISQTLLFNKEMDLKLKSDIKRKVRMEQNITKQKITNNLNKMNQDIKLEQEILNKYQRNFDKKLNYLEKHKEIEKAWKKGRINNLATKNPIIVKQPTESSSNLQENKK